MMAEFRSDHACMIQNSETDWMHARGQPASTRAWPAASGQLAGFHFASARLLGYRWYLIECTRAQMRWGPPPLNLCARTVYQVL